MKKLRKTVKRQQQQRKIYFYERLAGKFVKNDEVESTIKHYWTYYQVNIEEINRKVQMIWG